MTRNTVTVAISGRTIGIVVTIVVVFWLGRRLTDLLLVLSFAVVLSTVVDQPVSWLQRRGLPRPIGVLAIFATIVLLLAGVIAALVPLVNGELVNLRDELPGYGRELERIAHSLAPGADPSSSLSFGTLAAQLSAHIDVLVGRLTAITVEVGRITVLGFATLVISYFLAVDPTIGPRLLARFAPAPVQDRVRDVATVAHARIGGWVRGQALVALTFGAAMGLGLWILGVPYAVSLGVVASVLELVPYVGGVVTIVLASLAAATLGLPHVLAVIALYAVLVILESHVLSPVFLGHFVGLPSVAILIALLAGAEFLGIAGLLLAVPLTVIVWAVVDELWPVPPVPNPPAQSVGHQPL